MLKSFLSKILKKQEPKQEIKLSLNDLENRITKLRDKENKKVISEGKIIIDSVKSDIKQVRIALKKLAEEQISDQDKRAYDITKSSRKVLITHISNGLDKITISKEITYSSLKELNNSLIAFFNSISKASKSFSYTSIVLREQTKEVKDLLRKLENKKLKQILDSEDIRNLDNIIEKIKQIKNNENELQEMKKQRQTLEKTIKQQEQTKVQLKEEIEKLRSSEQYKSFLENKEKTKSIKINIKDTEMRIRTQISPLIKLLKKFEHIETDKSKIKNISLIIQDPIDFSLNDYQGLKNILIDLKGLILDNKIDLESKDKKKKLSRIKEIENNSLNYLLENYKKSSIDLEQSEKRRFPVLNEIIELESQLSSINKKILETKTLRIIDSIEKTKQDIISEKQKIQELCLKIDENFVLEEN